jgi:hypothetical protein
MKEANVAAATVELSIGEGSKNSGARSELRIC